MIILALEASVHPALGQPAPSVASRTGDTSIWSAPPAMPPRLTLETDADSSFLEVREEGRWDGKLGWRPLCLAPCGIPILPGYEFRVAAGGKATSDPFVMPDSAPAIVYARMGSRPERVTGIVLTSVGGGLAGLGVTFAASMSSCGSELGCDRESAEAALMVAAVGAVIAATGIYLMATSRSKVIVATWR
jgi:hypothetical protein